MPVRTSPDPWTTAARGLREAWRGALAGDAQAVHRARVATRRLREALPVVDGERRGGRRLRRELRDVTRVLGPIRELDVTLGLIVRMLHDEPDLDTALETMRVALMERRQRRRARLLRRIGALDIADTLGRVRAVQAGRDAVTSAPRVDRDEVRRRIVERADRLARAVERAGALYAPEALHDVRIAVKKLRYAVELGRAARVKGAAAAGSRLRRVQDLLGEWHDWQTLSAYAGRVQATMSLEDELLMDFAALTERVEDRCRALHARFLAERRSLLALTDSLSDAGGAVGVAARHK